MSPLDRRDFVKTGATAAVGASVVPSPALAGRPRTRSADRLRLGFIGVGGRGSWLLGLALRRDDCDVTAVCDIVPEKAQRSAAAAREAGVDEPALYTAGEEDWRNLITRDDVDAVIIATPWLWHTPMAVEAMEAGKAVGVEVPAATTVEDCWDLVRTHERTGMPCMMMENVCYRRDVMAVLRMVREGLFGELVHCQGGYQHDLRAVKFNPGAEFGPGSNGEAVWRTDHSIHRNGELYPTHGVGPVANWLNINRGNRFVQLTSTPYSLNFRVQGTRGLWMVDNRSIYLEGVSPEPHRWEPFETYQTQYEHPLWQKYAIDAEGGGHGGMDFFVMHAFVESVKRGHPTPLDVYDAAAWSVIGPLSERSIEMGNHPVAFPDFTGGTWATRTPMFALGNVY